MYAWLCAFRPPAQINLALPMLVGMVHLAAEKRALVELPWATALAVSLLLQGMILFSNEASDVDVDDPASRTPISGGAGVGSSGLLSSSALRRGAICCGAVGFLLASLAGGKVAALLWCLAATLVWAYDGSTLRLSRRPTGSLVQAIGVGVLTPLLSAALVTANVQFSLADLGIGLCLGLSGHLLTALPDTKIDREVGKHTLAVVLGVDHALALMLGGYALAGLQLGPMTGVMSVVVLCLVWRLRGHVVWAGLVGELWLSALVATVLWIAWVAQ